MPTAKTQKKPVKSQPKAQAKPAKPKPKLGHDAKPSGNGDGHVIGAREGREVIYPKVEVTLAQGENAVTAEQAKLLLGWQEVTDSEYDLTDVHGKKVRLCNCVGNRWFTADNADMIAESILRPTTDKNGNQTHHTKWRLNGETLIIGMTGTIISAQHRLVGLILAAQRWAMDKDAYPNWETEPVMETIVVYGIHEDEETTRTNDTGLGQTMAHAFYRSSHFADMPNKLRRSISRYAEHSVRCLWRRTGFATVEHRTNSEAMQFFEQHLHLKDCLKYVFDEEKISENLSIGSAAGLMYLMASGHSERSHYERVGVRTEDPLDWDLWDKSCSFWVDFANKAENLKPIFDGYAKIIEETGSKPSAAEKEALIALAWSCYVGDEEITDDALYLSYDTEEDGTMTLTSDPKFGGIDLGYDVDHSLSGEEAETPVDEEEKPAPKAETKKPSNPSKAKAEVFNVDDTVWVYDSEGEHYQATLIEVYENGSNKVAVLRTKSKKQREEPYQNLRREEP